MLRNIYFLVIITFLAPTVAWAQYWHKVTSIPQPYANNYWLDIYFLESSPNYGWICGFDGMVLRTTDGGANWWGTQIYQADHMESIHFASPDVGYVSGAEGIFKSTDGGISWRRVTPPGASNLWGCYFMTEDIGLVMGGGCSNGIQHFWRTTNGGATWTEFQGNLTNSGVTDAIVYEVDGLGYASSSGWIWRTTDGGKAWYPLYDTGTNVWQEEICHEGQSFLVPTSGVQCNGDSDSGGMRFSEDGGMSFRKHTIPTAMYGAFLTGPATGWVCGYDAAVYYTSDAGQTWELRNCGIEDGNMDDIWFVTSNQGWVVGEGVYYLSNADQPLSTEAIDFGPSCIPVEYKDTVWMYNHSFDRIEGLISIYSPSGDFDFSPDEFGLETCDSLLIEVTFRPSSTDEQIADVLIDLDNGEQLKISLSGSGKETKVFPDKDLIEFPPMRCGDTASAWLEWSSTQPDESVDTIYTEGSRDDAINASIVPFWVDKAPRTTSSRVLANPADTGWHDSKLRVMLGPCPRDTVITVRTYGISPIIDSDQPFIYDLYCTKDYTDSIEIRNTGNDVLTISSATISGSPEIAIAGWEGNATYPINIDPGADLDLYLDIMPDKPGNYSATVSIESNDSTRAFGYKNPYLIEYIINQESTDFQSDRYDFDFGKFCHGYQPSLTFTMLNNGNIPGEISLPDYNRHRYDIEPDRSAYPIDMPVDYSYSGRIWFTPVSPGIYLDTILIDNLPCHDTIMFIMHGESHQIELSAQPEKINATMQTSTTFSRMIEISSSSTDDVIINGAHFSPAFDVITITLPEAPITIGPDEVKNILVQFYSENDTIFSGELCFELEAICDVELCLPISLRSDSRLLTTSKSEIIFAPVLCRQPDIVDTVYIINSGTIRDTVSGITLSDGSGPIYIKESPDLPLYLDPDESAPIVIGFATDTEGDYYDELNIISSLAPDDPIVLPLGAAYYKSVFSASPTSIDFGLVELCDTPHTIEITLTNSGMLDDSLMAVSVPAPGYIYDKSIALGINSNSFTSYQVTIDPNGLKTGDYPDSLVFVSNICGDSLVVPLTSELFVPELVANPESIDWGSVWMEDSFVKTVVLRNVSPVPVEVVSVELRPQNVQYSYFAQLPRTLPADDTMMVDIIFTAANEGLAVTDMMVACRSICNDTASIRLTAAVPEEIYESTIIVGDYKVNAGDTVNVMVSLSGAQPRIELDSLDLSISYDKYLFRPYFAYLISGQAPGPVDFKRTDSDISLSLHGDQVTDLMKNDGDFLQIIGVAYLSLPDSTGLLLDTFDPYCPKELTITRDHGSLALEEFCEAYGWPKIRLLPLLSGSMTETSQSGGEVKVNISSTGNGTTNYKIYTLQGQKVRDCEITVRKGMEQYALDISGLSPGVYILVMDTFYSVYFRGTFLKTD